MELRAALDAARANLIAIVDDVSGMANTVTLDQSAVGRVSRGDAMLAQSMANAGRARAKARLTRVDNAIKRHDADPEGYGICADCDEPIGVGRMRAAPETVFCITCVAERGG